MSNDEPHTNVSRLVSFSFIDQNGNEVSIETNKSNPFEIIIPRDENLIISGMILQNISLIPENEFVHLHYGNITSSFPISIHFEIKPSNISLGYLFIYKFDNLPKLNNSIYDIDGWTLFCPSNLTNDGIYKYFIGNEQVFGHQSIIFGLRELNSTEIVDVCSNISMSNPPISNQRSRFTSNYELRIYSSGCYYLDSNNKWQSDGLIVGPLTNLYQIECFSTHSGTVAGSFNILPLPINWNYVFANANFEKNQIIYLTVSFISTSYFILIIYARYKDKKDLQKLEIISLIDNKKCEKYFYQIIVFTGHREDSGTKSNVYFILSGDKNKTDIRTFSNSYRKIFQRGGIDAFFMAVPK